LIFHSLLSTILISSGVKLPRGWTRLSIQAEGLRSLAQGNALCDDGKNVKPCKGVIIMRMVVLFGAGVAGGRGMAVDF